VTQRCFCGCEIHGNIPALGEDWEKTGRRLGEDWENIGKIPNLWFVKSISCGDWILIPIFFQGPGLGQAREQDFKQEI
jgi:hypothetical protein